MSPSKALAKYEVASRPAAVLIAIFVLALDNMFLTKGYLLSYIILVWQAARHSFVLAQIYPYNTAIVADLLDRLRQQVFSFRDQREWKQFHNPKDLAISLSLESNEVLEHFLWKKPAEIKQYLKHNKTKVADELSDVLHALLLLYEELDIDVESAFSEKMQQNRKKYPISKSRGKHTKHSAL
jgi:NTP pyrophosphatase (non-canonical NTP hydrolase)